MNHRILLAVAAVIGFSSCSTMYKSGQTPDDVYFSPAPQPRVVASSDDDNDDNYTDGDGQEYVNVETEQDRSAYASEDNYLRMKVRNPSMWSSIDDYGYGYGYGSGMFSPYMGSGLSFGFGGYNPYSFYNPYSYYGMGFGGLYGGLYNPYSYYNPYYGYGGYDHYYGGGIALPGKTRPAGSYGPRTSSLSRYGRTVNPEAGRSGGSAPVRVFRNSNNTYVNPGNSSSGGSPRRSANTSNDSRPSRSFESRNSNPSPSPSFSSPSSGTRSSGGGSSPSSSPGRGR